MLHHEIGLSQDILKKILDFTKEKGLKKIKKAKVKIGEFYLANPDQIKHSFSHVSKGTIAENIELNIVVTKIQCNDNNEIVSGKEMLVEEVE